MNRGSGSVRCCTNCFQTLLLSAWTDAAPNDLQWCVREFGMQECKSGKKLSQQGKVEIVMRNCRDLVVFFFSQILHLSLWKCLGASVFCSWLIRSQGGAPPTRKRMTAWPGLSLGALPLPSQSQAYHQTNMREKLQNPHPNLSEPEALPNLDFKP